MPTIATLEEARGRRRLKRVRLSGGDMADLARTDILVEDDGSFPELPNCKLVEQPPGFALQAQFHRVDQFQIVLGGSGWIGRNPVSPVMVHYASAYTGYGPVTAGDQGLSYLVFRLGVDPGAAWLPEERASMKSLPRFHALSPVIENEPTPESGTTHRIEGYAVAPQPNGLFAQIVCLPPNCGMDADAGAHRGRFIYVVSGAIEVWQKRHEAGACIALAANETAALRGAAGGARILLMQFPELAK